MWSAGVVEYFDRRDRVGRIAPGPGVAVVHAITPAAMARLEFSVRFERGQIVDACFHALGCPATLAASAWCAGQLVGKNPAELGGIDTRRMRYELDLAADRLYVMLIIDDALKQLATAAAKAIQDVSTQETI